MSERADYLLPSPLFRSLYACLDAVRALPATGLAKDAERLLRLLPPEDVEGGPVLVRFDLGELEAAHDCVDALLDRHDTDGLLPMARALKNALPPTCLCQ